MTVALAAGIRGAASQVMATGGHVLVSLAALALPASAIAQDVGDSASANAVSAGSETSVTFTPLKEVDRVRAEGCGKDQFDGFLYWYTMSTTQGGWLEQVIFTNYLVRVGDLNDPERVHDWADRMEYLGQFRITSRDVRASTLRPVMAENDDYRRITTTRLSDTKYRVDWAGGPGFAGVPEAQQFNKAGAYIFEHMDDCWYLTEDLR